MTAQTKASREPAPQNQEALDRLIDESRRFYFAEAGKAGERIARLASPSALNEAALRWVLEFASIDLNRCSEGGWSDCRYEVDYVGRQGLFERTGEQPMTAPKWLDSPDPEECEAQLSIRHIEIERLPSKTVVRELQREAQSFLNSIIRGEGVKIDIPPSEERLTVIREIINGEASTRLYRFLVLPNLNVAFRHHLLGILAEHGQALRSCPGCSTRFVADRRNKDYCNPSCRNRTYMRTKRNVPPERYGKRGRPRKEVPSIDQLKEQKKSRTASSRRIDTNRNQRTTTKGDRRHGKKNR
jgi:hypothetical protein